MSGVTEVEGLVHKFALQIPDNSKKKEQDIVDLYVCELAQQSTLVLMFQRYG